MDFSYHIPTLTVTPPITNMSNSRRTQPEVRFVDSSGKITTTNSACNLNVPTSWTPARAPTPLTSKENPYGDERMHVIKKEYPVKARHREDVSLNGDLSRLLKDGKIAKCSFTPQSSHANHLTRPPLQSPTYGATEMMDGTRSRSWKDRSQRATKVAAIDRSGGSWCESYPFPQPSLDSKLSKSVPPYRSPAAPTKASYKTNPPYPWYRTPRYNSNGECTCAICAPPSVFDASRFPALPEYEGCSHWYRDVVQASNTVELSRELPIQQSTELPAELPAELPSELPSELPGEVPAGLERNNTKFQELYTKLEKLRSQLRAEREALNIQDTSPAKPVHKPRVKYQISEEDEDMADEEDYQEAREGGEWEKL